MIGSWISHMDIEKNIIVLSEELGLYHALMKRFSSKYHICRYGYREWTLQKGTNSILQKDMMFIVMEKNDLALNTLHQIQELRFGAFDGFILIISDTEDREQQIHEKLSFLRAGADEYLAYPQTKEEILASIEAWVRRYERNGSFTFQSGGDSIAILPQKRQLLLNGIEVSLTKLEFEILKYLLLHRKQTVSYKELYEAAWGKEYLQDDSNIMAHIHRIRKKLGDDTEAPKYIQNVYGIGYRMEGE